MRVEKFPEPGGKVSATDFIVTSGGQAGNAAVAMARLGARVTYIGAVGDEQDDVANSILRAFAKENIDISKAIRVPGARSAASLIMLDAQGEKMIATLRPQGLHAAVPDDPAGTGAVPLGLVNEFLAYQKQTLRQRRDDISALLSGAGETGSTVITYRELQLSLTLLHGAELCRAAVAAVDSVEQMLYRQLQQALGRDLTPADVDAYAAHHLSRLYRARYAPRPFSYAIRRPNAYPEGSLAIEARPSAAG